MLEKFKPKPQPTENDQRYEGKTLLSALKDKTKRITQTGVLLSSLFVPTAHAFTDDVQHVQRSANPSHSTQLLQRPEQHPYPAADKARPQIIFENKKHKKHHRPQALHISPDIFQNYHSPDEYIYEDVCNNPGKYKMPTQQQIQAYVDEQTLKKFGPNQSQYVDLIDEHESSWELCAENPSGAFGIGQLLSYKPLLNDNYSLYKQTNEELRYIRDRYGNPQAAWAFWINPYHHWY
ncbi:MAG TPA: hypothetical protein VMR41_04465 [Patescibacteria group bacterium]|nr:hypothetical protein [Patescibacteria group bacterium]